LSGRFAPFALAYCRQKPVVRQLAPPSILYKVIENGVAEGVKLTRGYFYINVQDKHDTERVQALLTEWYRRQAQQVFKERLDLCFAKLRFLDLDYPEWTIRQMQTRWGSCTPEGTIILNLKLIQAPKVYIDYVVMHELCHLKEPNHGARFYELLGHVMPDWRSKREQLNRCEVS
jgi:predicted metal-dependent hydrolase